MRTREKLTLSVLLLIATCACLFSRNRTASKVSLPVRMDSSSTSSEKDPRKSGAANEWSEKNRNQDGDLRSTKQQASIQESLKNESISAVEMQIFVSNKNIENTMKPFSDCGELSPDIEFGEFLRKYRYCMGKLTTLVQKEKQTPSEEFGLLSNSEWRDMASRIATVKKGCRIPSAEITHVNQIWNILVYENQHLALFRHAKAASTTLMSYFLQLNNIDPRALDQKALHNTSYQFRWYEGESLESYFAFTAVRHPFQRLTSLYCNKRVMDNYEVVKEKIQNMSSTEREESLLKYNYRVGLGTEEPAVMVGPWIRRTISDHILPEDRRNDGSLLAHYLRASNFNETRNIYHSEQATDLPQQRVHSEEPTDQTVPNESFRTFVHQVVLQLLKCENDPKCIGRSDVHMRPQVVKWSPCVFNLDMIMKVETLDRDMKLMTELLGLPDFQKNGGDEPTERSEKTAEELTSGGIEKNLRRKRETEKRSGEEAPNYKNIGEAIPTGNKITKNTFVDTKKIVGNLEKPIDLGDYHENSEEKATKTTSEDSEESDPSTGFSKINSSGDKCPTYEEYMKQLSQRDIDLIYTVYYWDFKLFGYEPFD